MNKITVSIDILGKAYQIKCGENEVDALKLAASTLNEKMQTLQTAGKIINFDRVAVLAALNLTHQVMSLEQQSQQMIQTVHEKLQAIHGKVEAALSENSQMEFASE